LALREGVAPTRAIALANGVDLERFQPLEIPPIRGACCSSDRLLTCPMCWRSISSCGKSGRGFSRSASRCTSLRARGPEYYLERYQDRVKLDLGQHGVGA